MYQLWVKDAKPEQQGSFCDLASRHHYLNINGLLALIAINEAEERGDDVLILDRTPDTEEYRLDERFNLFRTTQDHHGLLVAAELYIEAQR